MGSRGMGVALADVSRSVLPFPLRTICATFGRPRAGLGGPPAPHGPHRCPAEEGAGATPSRQAAHPLRPRGVVLGARPICFLRVTHRFGVWSFAKGAGWFVIKCTPPPSFYLAVFPPKQQQNNSTDSENFGKAGWAGRQSNGNERSQSFLQKSAILNALHVLGSHRRHPWQPFFNPPSVIFLPI